jgi:AsmA protein
MKRKPLIILAAIIGVLVLIVVLLPFVVDVNHFRPMITSQMQQALGRPVQIGDLRLSILAGGVTAENISIGEDPRFGQAPFLKARSLDVGVSFLPLIFSHSMHVNSITLNEPEVRLIRGAGGKWNFSSLGTATEAESPRVRGRRQPVRAPQAPQTANSAQNLSIGTLRVSDGRLLVAASPGLPPREYTDVQLKARDIGYDSEIPFTLGAKTPGGGSLKLDGKAGPINREDSAQTPLSAKVSVRHFDLASSSFVDPASGMAGLVDYDGLIRSNGKQAHTEGKVKADKLRLVRGGGPAKQPVNLDYATDYDVARKQGTLTRGDVHFGNTAAHVGGNYAEQGEATVVHLKMTANNMPMQEIQGLLPAFGVTLPAGSSLQGGTVTANLAIDGPLDHLVVTGPLNVANTRLAGFSFASKMSAFAALAGVHGGNETDIQTLSSDLRIAPDGIRADNLNLIVPALGAITGAGTIGNNNALNFKMLAKLNNGGGLLGGLSNLSTLGHSKGELPFLIQGTTANPIFIPNVGKAIGNTVTAPAQGVGGILGGLFGKKKNN